MSAAAGVRRRGVGVVLLAGLFFCSGCLAPKRGGPVEELPPLVLEVPAPPDEPPQGMILELESEHTLPMRFRRADQPKHYAGLVSDGISVLRISASGFFDRDQLYALQQELLGESVTLLNLRAEPHGMVNRAAVTWMDDEPVGDPDGIAAKRLKELMTARRAPVTRYTAGISRHAAELWREVDLAFDVRTIATPERLARDARWDYEHVALRDDVIPADREVRELVRVFRDIPEGGWLHVYCDTGGYRSSLVLAMFDIFKNHMRVSIEDILRRQQRLSGVSFSEQPEMASFLARFHRYCTASAPNFRAGWRGGND